MVNRVLAPSDRTAKVTLFVLVAALLWSGPPAAAAQDCAHRVGGAGGDASTTVTRGLEVLPSDGQYSGETIQIAGSGFEAFQAVLFEFGGNLDSFDFGSAVTDLSGSFVSTQTVPDVPAGTYTLTVAQFLSNATTYCSSEYTVLLDLSFVPTLTTLAMIDGGVIATTSQPTTPEPVVPPVTALESTDTAAEAAPPTDTTTTGAEPSTTAATEATVLVAPEPTDSGSDGMLLGLLIGLGVSVVAVSAWALGRRGRTGHQPPAPPPI